LIILIPFLIIGLFLKMEILFRRMLTSNWKRLQTLAKQIEKGVYKKPIKKCRNIYAEYTPEKYDEHLYLTAHYDSTTLKLDMKIMRIFIMIAVFGLIIYLVSYFAHYFLIWKSGFNLFGKYPFFFLIVLIISLVSLSTVLIGRSFRSNHSHGAIDNLTGIALILELANIAKELKPNLKITFIAFSAEEVGLFGSIYHFNRNEEYFKTHKIHVVSIDMIGEIPPLNFVDRIKPVFSIPMDTAFNLEMVELAQKLNIQTKVGKFFYPGSDFANWLLNGYPANWIITPSKYIHSAQDLPQNVNQDLLNDCLKVLTAYLLQKSE